MEWCKKWGTASAIEEEGFNGWVVVDKNIPYQQNISKLPCAVIVLDVFRNTLQHLATLLPDLLIVLDGISENKVVVISKRKNN
jgi:hypothetical protein